VYCVSYSNFTVPIMSLFCVGVENWAYAGTVNTSIMTHLPFFTNPIIRLSYLPTARYMSIQPEPLR